MSGFGGLEVDDLRVIFGGLVAVDGVSLHAPEGVLSGLIGPNGAGKTTIFNACTGLLKPTDGRVRLFGEDVTRLQPPQRAQRGLGRTFQRMELYNSLTVTENVALGREAAIAGTSLRGQLLESRQERRNIREATEEAIELCGISSLASLAAGTLSTGQRRLVELARALAGRFRVLLLDEPSSGLDVTESERFGKILRTVVELHSVGILLVEHDIQLVVDVCEHIYVMDFGELIFEGSPDDVRSSEIVRSAYLGSTVA